ncbi:hypothetical protein ACFV98_02765 [Streptomyces violascens]|uniref:hypothetical protein n=1 Tax=Streptomyces violascens TaxID=67381 RepID=UPI00365F53C3
MTIQPPPSKWSIAREVIGLLLLSVGTFGVLFTLAELSIFRVALALMVVMAGVAVGGVLITGIAMTRLQRRAGAAVAISGYVSVTACAYLLWQPLGNLAVACALVAGGAWLASEGRA